MNPGWPAHLYAGRVGVRPLRIGDATRWEKLHRANRDWLTPWEATLPPGSPGGFSSPRHMVRSLRRRARLGQSMPFIVMWDGQMVGQLTVSNIVGGSAQWASIGYWIARSHAGRGIMPVAVALVCDHLFARAGMHRIEIAIRPENTASLRIVEKLGFSCIGLAPGYLHIDGDWRDHWVYQILAEDCREGIVTRVDAPDQPAEP